MDIGRFQAKLTNLISGKGINVKGSDVEKIKQEAGMATQAGPKADTIEINFAQLKEVVQNKPSSDVASIVNDISQMSASEAQAALNPEVVKKLVQAGIME
jgi:hypothetical protein